VIDANQHQHPKERSNMKRSLTLTIALIGAAILGSWSSDLKAAEGGDQAAAAAPAAATAPSTASTVAPKVIMKKPVSNPPFLITQGMPHVVGKIMKRWDDPTLALDEKQKEALLRSRKETLAGVKRFVSSIAILESRVIAGDKAKLPPEDLRGVVDEIARLKAEATMLHLRCLHTTRSILSVSQMDMLLESLEP
jgi:hypothetical protein